MSSKVKPLVRTLAALLLLALPATALATEETSTPPVVGQLLAGEARIDGVAVPRGATLLSGSLLSTQSQAVSVHMSNGQLVELGSHSSARFEKAGGEVEVSVGTGSLRFRAEDGNVRVAGPSDRVFFSQRRAGRPIYENQEGVVAVLERAASRGSRQLAVSDASRVEPASELVVRTRAGDRQELKCSIRDIRDGVVTVGEDLRFGYGPEDLLVQRPAEGPSSVRATLIRQAERGDRRLRVDDTGTVNPLERIEIRHPSRPVREVACVRFTDGFAPPAASGGTADASPAEETIGLFTSLRNSYPPDAEVVQGARDAEIATTLSEPASSGQRVLRVTGPESIDPLMQVVVRTAGGDHVEAYCVQAVEEDRVILAEELDLDYPAGSQVLQGRSAREAIASGVMLQRVANCCCCCDGRGGLVLPFAWWWFIPPAVLPILPQLPGDEPPDDAELPPTQIVP